MMASGVVAGGLAQIAETPKTNVALAANNDPILVGTTVSGTLVTQINSPGSYATVIATNTSGIGINGISTSQTGVLGSSNSGVGVSGNSTNASGVFGASVNAPGVSGYATANPGIQGSSASSNGVLGTTSTNVGVFGDATGGGTGLVGRSDSGYGTFSQSRATIATFSRSVEGVGILAQTLNANSFAGQFEGSVYINGNFSATGMKSAVVPGKDGAMVRYYCAEATEAWFEDYGEAQLSGGSAKVNLDETFASTVKTEGYQVFLTPYGSSRGLFVTNRTGSGFEVVEQGGGSSSITFGYKIVARRKDLGTSVESTRLAPVNSPSRTSTSVEGPKPGIEQRDLPKPPSLPDGAPVSIPGGPGRTR
jgi:hypothetical protein